MNGKMIAMIGVLLVGLAIGVGLASTAGSAQEAATYVGATKCRICHLAQYRTWQAGPKDTEAWNAVKDQPDVEKCLPCHTTGYGRPGGFVSVAATPHLTGIQCEACHGPGSAHIAAPAEQKKATINRNQQDCRTCHNPHIRDKAAFVRGS
jgi:ribosomal protein L40E